MARPKEYLHGHLGYSVLVSAEALFSHMVEKGWTDAISDELEEWRDGLDLWLDPSPRRDGADMRIFKGLDVAWKLVWNTQTFMSVNRPETLRSLIEVKAILKEVRIDK